MSYRVEFAKQAAKQFKALPPQEQERLRLKIDALSSNPRPSGLTKLAGEENLYRIRVGNYRIIYSIYDRQLMVLVVKIGHRKEVYR
jgi:mRNA interferase RelE/StbE